VINRLNGVIHLYNLITTEVNKVAVVGGANLQLVPGHFAFDLFAEVLVDPSDFSN
jgi:hypothetical protein